MHGSKKVSVAICLMLNLRLTGLQGGLLSLSPSSWPCLGIAGLLNRYEKWGCNLLDRDCKYCINAEYSICKTLQIHSAYTKMPAQVLMRSASPSYFSYNYLGNFCMGQVPWWQTGNIKSYSDSYKWKSDTR